MIKINLFFVFSSLGYLFEKGAMAFFGSTYNSSLLYGPWTFVYGISSLLIVFVGDKLSKLNIKKIFKVILFLIINFIMLSLLELFGGILIEKTLGITYWDYSNAKIHLGKYLSLNTSLIWMAYSFVVYYILYPRIKKYLVGIPKIITIILTTTFLIDAFYTVFEIIKYR